ncbi:MAG: hypothetical protein ACRDN0_12290 [Trebonia sp.]
MPEPAVAAEEAGREWGAYLTPSPPRYQRLSAAEAVGRLTAAMRDMGFDPQAATADDGMYRLRLRGCPFIEVARQHQDVVCGLHLGLMRGAFSAMRAPVTADELDTFAEPGLCVARLSAQDDSRADRPPEGRSRDGR